MTDRVTQERIQEVIGNVAYYVFPATTLTVCCIVLKNGFCVTGESACVSPANFDAEVGKKIAFDNAVEKIWALEGYALRERLNGPLTAIGEGYARKVAEDLMGGKN
jgi:hypothetical protein